MKFVSLWVCVMALVCFHGCSAEEPAETLVVNTTPENSIATVESTDGDSQTAEVIKVAQADTQDPPSQAPATKPVAQSPFKQGTHYKLLTPTQPTSSSPDEIEVAEAFMYGCPHCFSFEPFLQKWVPDKPENVNVVRIPVLFNRQAEVHARVYYTAEALGVIEKTHLPFFKEIHVNRRAMTSKKDLVDFFGNYGIDEATFEKAFKSFDVEHKLRVARTMSERYRISSVPTVIVNGKYTSGGSNLAGNQLLGLIDHLVEREGARE